MRIKFEEIELFKGKFLETIIRKSIKETLGCGKVGMFFTFSIDL